MLTFILFLAAAAVFFLVVKQLVSKKVKTSNSTFEVVVENPVKSSENSKNVVEHFGAPVGIYNAPDSEVQNKKVVEYFGAPLGTSSETVASAVTEANEVVRKVKKTATKKATTKKPTKKSK
jgi:hypothetical protein